jgi:hypothetical protein
LLTGLHAALSLARALSVRARVAQNRVKADLTGMDRAIRAVEKHAQSLEDVAKWARTIVSDGQKIQQRAERMQDDLLEQVALLDGQRRALEDALAGANDL